MDNSPYKKGLLLEDYIDDITADIMSDEVESVTPDGLRKAYPYYVKVSVIWERTFENPDIPVVKIMDNIERIMSLSRLFLDDPHLESLTVKSDTNRADQPKPLIYGSANIPDTVDGRNVLINDYYGHNNYHRVDLIYKFLFKGLRKTSFDKFATRVRHMMTMLKNVGPKSTGTVELTFYRNEGAEKPFDERITDPNTGDKYDARHFATNYSGMHDNLALIYNALIKSEEDDEVTSDSAKESLKYSLYSEANFALIIKDAVKNASKYGLKAKYGNFCGPDAEEFARSSEDSTFAFPFTLDSVSNEPIDVEQIELWIIIEIVFRINLDLIDIANFCFPLKCMCKVTNKQIDEIVREYREKHPNNPRMTYQDKQYHYFRGSKNEIKTQDCQNFDNKYIWRARVGEYVHHMRTSFGILIGDKNGFLTKNLERITYPMSPWNDIIEIMRDPGSKLFK